MDKGLRPVRYDVALALQQLSAADAKLGALIERVGPFALRVKSTHSPFEALLEAILYQQLHANAARAILGRLLALFGDLHPRPEQLLAVPDEMLRAAGLSQGKLLSLRDLAAKTLDGTVPSLGVIRRLPVAAQVQHLHGCIMETPRSSCRDHCKAHRPARQFCNQSRPISVFASVSSPRIASSSSSAGLAESTSRNSSTRPSPRVP